MEADFEGLSTVEELGLEQVHGIARGLQVKRDGSEFCGLYVREGVCLDMIFRSRVHFNAARHTSSRSHLDDFFVLLPKAI